MLTSRNAKNIYPPTIQFIVNNPSDLGLKLYVGRAHIPIYFSINTESGPLNGYYPNLVISVSECDHTTIGITPNMVENKAMNCEPDIHSGGKWLVANNSGYSF
jgi:hypothetical protein